MVSKVTGFKLNIDLVKQLKIKAVEKDVTSSKLLEEYIIQGLNQEKENEKPKIEYNGLNDLIGIGRSKERTNAVELDRELYQ